MIIMIFILNIKIVIDLVAIKDDVVYFIQCKKKIYFEDLTTYR